MHQRAKRLRNSPTERGTGGFPKQRCRHGPCMGHGHVDDRLCAAQQGKRHKTSPCSKGLIKPASTLM